MKPLFLFLFIGICINAYPQKSLINSPLNDNPEYNKFVRKKIRNLDCYNNNEEYSLLIIYDLNLKIKSKEIFTNDSLFNNLEFFYVNEKSFPYPHNQTVIYNSNYKVIASSNYLNFYCNFNSGISQDLLDYAIQNNPEIIFHISGSNGLIYFAIQNGIIKVLEFSDEGITAMNLEQFVNCCWDKFYFLF